MSEKGCLSGQSLAHLCRDGQVVLVSGCGEVVAALLRREVGEGLPDGVPQIRNGAGRCGPEQGLQLGEGLLDRIEVAARSFGSGL